MSLAIPAIYRLYEMAALTRGLLAYELLGGLVALGQREEKVLAGLLESEAGRRELSAIAERYYRVTNEAIRRYDPNHLILGDRWEANRELPEEVVRAALPYVDVFSFQCFGPVDNIATRMRQWADFVDRPVLLADAAGHIRAHDDTGWPATMEGAVRAGYAAAAAITGQGGVVEDVPTSWLARRLGLG